MSQFKRIGRVEILKTRTYPIDPSNKYDTRMEAVVEPSVWTVLSDGISHLWFMEGLINGNSMRRGDGMFFMKEGDDPIAGLNVRFPSPIFGPDEWAELLEHEVCQDGHPEQRLRFTIDEE